jgi:hypothetical protein
MKHGLRPATLSYPFKLSLGLALIYTVVACAGPPPASPPTAIGKDAYSASVRAFARLPLIQSLKLSPSGQYLAFLMNAEGDTILVTRSITGEDQRVLMRTDNKIFKFRWFEWVSDDRLAISALFPDRRGFAKTVETRLLAMNRDGSQLTSDLIAPRLFDWTPEHLSQVQDQVIDQLPDDLQHVLVALDLTTPVFPDVYRLNILTGNRTLVQRNHPPVTQWITDRQGNVRLGMGLQGTRYSIILKDSKTGVWQEFSGYDGENRGRDGTVRIRGESERALCRRSTSGAHGDL